MKILNIYNRYGQKIAETMVDDNIARLLKSHILRMNGGYAYRYTNKTRIFLHREIMGQMTIPKRARGHRHDFLEVDHINRNPLDNRRNNLRLVTVFQQQQNVTSHRDALSRYRGVSFWGNRWYAQVWINGRWIFRKSFSNERAAARAASVARKTANFFLDSPAFSHVIF